MWIFYTSPIVQKFRYVCMFELRSIAFDVLLGSLLMFYIYSLLLHCVISTLWTLLSTFSPFAAFSASNICVAKWATCIHTFDPPFLLHFLKSPLLRIIYVHFRTLTSHAPFFALLIAICVHFPSFTSFGSFLNSYLHFVLIFTLLDDLRHFLHV